MELVFIGLYFVSNSWVKSRNIDALRRTAEEELQRIVEREAIVIEQQLSRIAFQTEVFRRQTALALETPRPLRAVDADRLALSSKGTWYSTRNRPDGSGAAFFFSGHYPLNPSVKDRVARLAELQPLMKDLKDAEPLAAALYFNTFDSFNIIYPYFDVNSQYPAGMDIPSYNFYYEADAKYNPGRAVRWTKVYIDPAGNGWMASCIAPVYRGDFLEGVVGIDVTVGTLTRHVLDLKIPWDGYGMLVDGEGTIMALPPAGEQDWGLEELTQHHYAEYILKDTFKPEQFNLFQRTDVKALGERLSSLVGNTHVTLKGRELATAWATVPSTGWKLLVMVPEEAIHANANALNAALHRNGLLMLVGLVVFYLVFFSVLYSRARRMTHTVASPLRAVNEMVKRIGEGEYVQPRHSFEVQELHETACLLVEMGNQLDAADVRRREMEGSLIRARELAERANLAKSDFLSRMSHELRTPMNAILGFAQLLEFDPSEPLTPAQQASVNEILRAGQHLLNLINEVLDLARIESGRFSVSIEPVEVGPLIEESLALVHVMAAERAISIIDHTQRLADRLVRADRTRLKEVLVNLLSNAVKYNRENGMVTLSASLVQDDRLRLSVIDTGIGIPEAQLPSIFDPFFRIQNDASVEGAGIGLTIARQLIELMGGTIGVTSRVGEGSHFWVELPIAEALPEQRLIEICAAPVANPTSSGESRYHTVLYIEDNPANLALVRRLLSLHPQLRVLTASHPEDGILLAQQFRPDLILLDINLPGMNGFTVLDQLRRTEGLQIIPVIAVSANAMPRDVEAGISAGFAHYITKPINIFAFIRAIESTLGLEHIELREDAA